MHFVTLNTDAYTMLLISSIFLHLKLELPLSSSPGTFNMENAFAGWNALTERGEVELGGAGDRPRDWCSKAMGSEKGDFPRCRNQEK